MKKIAVLLVIGALGLLGINVIYGESICEMDRYALNNSVIEYSDITEMSWTLEDIELSK